MHDTHSNVNPVQPTTPSDSEWRIHTIENAPYANCTSIQSRPMMIREHKWSVHGPLCGKTASVTVHYRT